MITLHSMGLLLFLFSIIDVFILYFVCIVLNIRYEKIHKNEDVPDPILDHDMNRIVIIAFIITIILVIIQYFFLSNGWDNSEIIHRQSKNYDVISVSEDTVTYEEDGNIKTHSYTKVEESNSTFLTIETYDEKTKVLPFVTVEEPQKTYILHTDYKNTK